MDRARGRVHLRKPIRGRQLRAAVHAVRENAAMDVTRSTREYSETARSLIDAIERRGLTVFARIDHAAGARGAGLELDDEQVVLFGSPLSGTPLMQRDRRIGI